MSAASRSGRPAVLVLAGNDPSGGAGVVADGQGLAAAGAECRPVWTADTDQDAAGVRSVRAMPAAAVEDEAARWLERGDVAALKFGLLPDAEAIAVAARLIRRARALGVEWFVLDPVLAPTRGPRFHGPEGIAALLEQLGQAGCVWTPNLPELSLLSGIPLAGLKGAGERWEAALERRSEATKGLIELGARAVIVKGGHGGEDPLVDSGHEPGRGPWSHERPRLAGPGIRGSGCRYAAHLAGGLALGQTLPEAAGEAGRYLATLIGNRNGE